MGRRKSNLAVAIAEPVVVRKEVVTNLLRDEYSVSGNDLSELYSVLEDITNRTKIISTTTKQIQLYTLHDISDTVNGYLHSKNGTILKSFSFDQLKAETKDDILVEELDKMKLMFVLDDIPYYTTKRVLKTLSQRAGSAMGDFALRDEDKVRFHRDAGYIAYMNAAPSECQIVYREENDIKKIFAVFTDQYKKIPQYEIVKKLIDGFKAEMGKVDIEYFNINNFDTDIQLSFPEKATDFDMLYKLPEHFVPGLHIHMSDVGESSFIINGTISRSGSVFYIPNAEFARAHTKNADIDEISVSVETTIFPEYTKVPERFLELLTIDITNPFDLIPKVSNFCGLKKIIGNKNEKEIVNNLQSAIGPMNYTAYDIANMFLDMSSAQEKNRTNNDSVSKVRQAFIKSVFFNYKGN